MEKTIELCRKLKSLNWVGYEDPISYNKDNPYNIGGAWVLYKEGTPMEEYIPNPGRQQLVDEIKKLIGEERFQSEVIKGRKGIEKQLFSHEDWMEIWIHYKEHDVK